MKEYRNTCRTIFLTASLSALIISLPACSGPSPAETTPVVTSPTDDDQSNALTILSIADGSVLVMRPGETEWFSGEAGMSLEEDCLIKTGGSSRAKITFFEGSTIELEAGTEIRLSELGIDGTASNIRIEQGLGSTISRVKKLVDPASSYEVETASAVAAVRGTTLAVAVAPDGTTVVTNIEGQISVTAQGVEVELDEGERTTVEPGEPPAPPEPTATVTQRGALPSPTPTPDIAAIGIEKTCSQPTAFPGDNLTYTYYVSNEGDVPLANVTVTDDKAGEASYADGDDNQDGILDEGENWILTAEYTVKDDESGQLTNTAIASGTGPDGQQATAQASAAVTITDIIVEITSLEAGQVVGQSVIVSGTVNDPSIAEGVLTLNGSPRDISVIDGHFSESLELNPGVTYTITVTVTKPPDITRTTTVILEPEPGGK